MIEKTVWKGTLKEAQTKEDLYWSGTTEEERLQALLEIRFAIFGKSIWENIEKVVIKRRKNEE